MFKFVGSKFAVGEPWSKQEHDIIDSISTQIKNKFQDQNNILINITWLGPQFNNGVWQELENLNEDYDNVFWLAAVDPVTVKEEQREYINKKLNAKNVFEIGASFNPGQYTFNTGAIASYQDFPNYTTNELELKDIKYKYMCLNRKPKPHRIRLVNKLFEDNLQDYGLITLGDNDVDYDVTEGLTVEHHLTIKDDDPSEYVKEASYNSFGGVPFDVCSLGKINIWQQHLLNIVSETEYRPWDYMFVTEKTWKPIVGLRPFIINGQPQIYQWLRDNGFKTFTHCFDVELEDVNEEQIIDNISIAVKQLCEMNDAQISNLYRSMYPDLVHNRNRFFEFAKEQINKMENIFE